MDVTIKLYDKDGVSEISELLEGLAETPQTVQNLLLVTTIFAYAAGFEYEDLADLLTTNWKTSKKHFG